MIARVFLRTMVLLVIVVQLAGVVVAQRSRGGRVSVRGYFRRDGTFVQPHHRSAPDGNVYNNWSTKGNINPFSGKEGTRVTPPAGFSGGYAYVLPPTRSSDTPSLLRRDTNDTRPPQILPSSPSLSPPTLLPLPLKIKIYSAEDYFAEGMNHFRQDRMVEAASAFKEAARLKPYFGRAYHYGGVSNLLLGRHQIAVTNFERAIQLDVDAARARCGLGWSYRGLGRFSDALLAFKQAVRLASRMAFAHFGLGMQYQHMGQHRRAVRPLREAIRLDPSDPYAHLELGLVYATIGDQKRANDQYQALSTLDPRSADELRDAIQR